MFVKDEFNLDMVSKARNAIEHFNKTHPDTSLNPAIFSDVLKAVFCAEMFSNDELRSLCVTEEIIGKAFLGSATDMHRDDRKAFLFLAKERANKILGIPSESTFALQQQQQALMAA